MLTVQTNGDSGVTPRLPVTIAKEMVHMTEQLGFVFRRQDGKCAELDSLGVDLCYAGGQSANPNP